jgi:hypothetical protein
LEDERNRTTELRERRQETRELWFIDSLDRGERYVMDGLDVVVSFVLHVAMAGRQKSCVLGLPCLRMDEREPLGSARSAEAERAAYGSRRKRVIGLAWRGGDGLHGMLNIE